MLWSSHSPTARKILLCTLLVAKIVVNDGCDNATQWMSSNVSVLHKKHFLFLLIGVWVGGGGVRKPRCTFHEKHAEAPDREWILTLHMHTPVPLCWMPCTFCLGNFFLPLITQLVANSCYIPEQSIFLHEIKTKLCKQTTLCQHRDIWLIPERQVLFQQTSMRDAPYHVSLWLVSMWPRKGCFVFLPLGRAVTWEQNWICFQRKLKCWCYDVT